VWADDELVDELEEVDDDVAIVFVVAGVAVVAALVLV